jgi:hypothetical protein
MNGAVESTLANFTATVNWAFGAFGDAVGFPVAAAFHEQRLVFLKDNYVHGSKIGDFFDFHIGTDADEPYSFGIAATELNIGRWLASHDVLLVGTEGAEYAIRGVSDAAISPTSIRIKEQSAFGSDTQPALKIGQTLLYVQRGGRRVYDLAFDLDNNKYLSSDLTLIANHIFADDPIRDSAFQLNPDPVAWFVSDGGVLVSLTIIKSQDVISWARHIVTGTTVEAVAVIPLSTADNDDVWIAGDEFIGYLDDTLYVDWGLSETFASASTSISGIDHLEGETVTINGDGAVYTDRTVTDGAITIADTEAPITTIQVGRSFTPTVVPVSPEFQLPTGPSFGAKKRFTRLLVFAVDTMTLQLNGEQVAPRDPEDLMDAAPTIEAEEIFQFTSLGAAEIVRLSIQQPLPLAMDVTSLYGEVEIE